VDVDKAKKAWEIDAVAKDGTKKGSASYGKGKSWVADELEGAALFLAPQSQETKNKKAVADAEAEFQKKWEALVDQDPLTYMKSVGASEVSDFEGKRAYKKMVMKTEFRNPDADAGTIEYRVTVSPNAQDTKWKTLAKGGDDVEQGLKKVHPDALADVKSTLDGMSTKPKSWAKAKEQLPGQTPLSVLWPKPTTLGPNFAKKKGHPQAVQAVKDARTRQEAKDGKVPDKAKADPAGYASDKKSGTLHVSKPLAALHDEIWNKSREPQALEAMTVALQEKMELGDDPDLNRTVAVYEAVAKKIKRESAWSKPPEPYTASGVKKARQALRKLVVDKYKLKDLTALHNDLIATNDPIPSTHNSLKGSFYDAWAKKYHGNISIPPGFHIKKEDYTVKADGWITETDEIVEFKAVTRGPSDREIQQMVHYVTICQGIQYFCAKGGVNYNIKRVVYSFSSAAGLALWEDTLAMQLKEIEYRTVVGQP